MLVPILLVCLVFRMGNAHPDHSQPSITRFLPRRQVGVNATASVVSPGTTSSGITLPPSSSSSARPSSSTQPSSTRPSSSSNTDKIASSKTSGSSSSKTSGPSSSKTSGSSGSKTSGPSTKPNQTSSVKPTTTYSTPSSYPLPSKETPPVTTTYGPITATISGKPVTLAYSGEVFPLQTVANHKPIPSSFKDAVLAALAKDPDTQTFGDLLKQMPAVFEGLEEGKEYYVFAPTTQFVIDFLMHHGQRLARREVFVPPAVGQQFAEKPKGAPDIKSEPATLKTSIGGETTNVNPAAGEGARVVSNPTPGGKGTVLITSGFGNSTLVHADDVPFDGGIIKKCDSFFTLPRPLETVFADSGGRSWSIALQNAGLLTEVSSKPMVTVFAVQDGILDPAKPPGSDVLNGLIHDKLSYTPDMKDGLCLSSRAGGSLRITTTEENGKKESQVNGVRITAPNVIFRGGVIQYLDKIPPLNNDPCPPPDTTPKPSPTKSDGSVVVVSRMAILGLSVTSLAVYFWM